MTDTEPVRVSTGSSSETETTREQRERVEQARDDRTRSQQRVDISEWREATGTDPRPVERNAVEETESTSVTDRISSTIDSVRDRPGGTVAAAGLGVAAIPEPTPATETAGLAVAGTALATGAVVEGVRRSEISVPSRGSDTSQSEIETPTNQQPQQSEVGVGSGDVTQTEIQTPVNPQQRTGEVSVPQTRDQTGEVSVPAIETAQQIGITQQPDQQIGQRRDEVVLDRETIDDVERADELDEPERLRQIREELERRQEFVREDQPLENPERDPVRFPADEATVGTDESLVDSFEPTFEPTADEPTTVTETTPPGDDIIAGIEQDVDGPSGTQFTDPTGTQFTDTTGTQFTEPTVDVGGETSIPGIDVGPVETTGTQTREQVVTATQQQQAVAAQQAEAQAEAFAQPEQTALAEQFAEPTQVAQQTARTRQPRDPPRPPIPGVEDGDEEDPFGFAIDDDTFDTGFLGGDEAFEDAFGR